MKLQTPQKAVRLIPGKYRKTYSPWHLQRITRMNKTVCGIIIASGRGWKYRNDAFFQRLRDMDKWEGKRISEITKGKFCAGCLGAMIVVKEQR